MIYDSPGHVGLETLHQFLEGVKKTNFFLKIRRLFVKFSMNDVKIYRDFSTKSGLSDSANL